MLKPLSPFLIAILLFGVLECLLNFSPISVYLDQNISNSLDQKLAQLHQDQAKPIDLLFLGTSRTSAGFHTQRFEQATAGAVNAFNLGIPDSDYYFFKLLLEQHIQKYGKPKLLLVEATDFLLNSHRLSHQEIVYFHHLVAKNPKAIVEILSTPTLSQDDKKEIVLSLVSAVYRYRSLLALNGRLSDVLLNFGRPLKTEPLFQGWEQLSIKPGMVTERSRKEMIIVRVKNLFQDFHQVDTSKLNLLVQACRQKKIPLVLVHWPALPAYETALHQTYPQVPRASQYFSDFAQKASIPFIDLSQKAPKEAPPSLFADSDHLNPDGANFYTDRLYQSLKDLPISKQVVSPK